MKKTDIVIATEELTKVFQEFDDEFGQPQPDISDSFRSLRSPVEDRQKVEAFLGKSCSCGKNCQAIFSVEEILDAREDFNSLSFHYKNCFILAQLRSFMHIFQDAKTGRVFKERKRQRFDYRINADRPVCREMFLFYHGETIRRLKYLQKYLVEVGTSSPVHGNKGKKPIHALSDADKSCVESFITNYAAMHGLPDPGRDLRTGHGKLKILLPSIMNYKSVHRIYLRSMRGFIPKAVEYHSFIRIWHEVAPHICFLKPRTDLCLTCQNHKKAINLAANLSEEEKITIHEQAIKHLEEAKKERDYYNQPRKHTLL